jgi:opacity protein-like surface antigen
VGSWESGLFSRGIRSFIICLLPSIAIAASSAQSPNRDTPFARRNTIGIFAAYSNDSSHILAGEAEHRKLLEFGISYSRRLTLNSRVNWEYDVELMPVALVGDPLIRYVNTQTSPTNETFTGVLPYPMVKCTPQGFNYDYTLNGITYSGTQVDMCYGRRWTMGQAFSPFGMKLNFIPRAKLQPFIIGHGGYMFSTQAVPIEGAGSFNFTVDCGAGLEYFLSKSKSMRVEYRYHHFSNADTADLNPGVDNGMLQVTYSFWP